MTMTPTIELPETLINEFHARQISEQDIKKVMTATLEIWLSRKEVPLESRFNESAVPFVRNLISQNRELFETLAHA